MSVLRENQCYGLAAGGGGGGGAAGGGGAVSVFHVKMTDSAARAFDTYQRAHSQSPLSHPVICFEGDHGRITVPCPEGGGDKRTFTFSLTNMERHAPNGSFDCVRQVATSAAGAGQLSCVGLVQRRLTVNATDESYQKAWQNMALAEEETRKRSAIIIKDGVRVQKKRVTVRAPGPALVSLARPRSLLAGGNQRRRSSLSGRGGGGGRSARAGLGLGLGLGAGLRAGPGVEVDKMPLRERLVHLLAVRPYRRPELLLRLRQDGLTDGEKDSLDALLLEVGQVNSRDGTTVLRDRLYSELQKDWPGYSLGDQQLLRRILVRRLFKPHRNLLSVTETQVSPLRDTPNSSPARTHKHSPLGVERPHKHAPLGEECAPSTAAANNKPRVSRLSAGRGVAVATGDHPPPRKRPARPDDRLEAGGDVTMTTKDDKNNNNNNNNNNNRRGGVLDTRRLSDSLSVIYKQQEDEEEEKEREEEVSERLQPECFSSCSPPGPRESPTPLPQAGPPPQAPTAPPPPRPDGPQTERRMKRRRRSRHRDREQEVVRSRDKEEKTGDLKSKVTSDCTDARGTVRDSGVLRSASNMTDYLSAYTVICGQEQRLSYKQDFNEEYSEYRGLHARIDGVTRQFMTLNTQLQKLRRGSSKYKTIRNQILQEYRKIKKSNPNYNQNKVRCEYLHNKLAHIKKVISVYDQQRTAPE